MDKETQNALNAAEAERFHFEFELRALGEELESRHRISRGEDDRLAIRRDCNDREVDTLRQNIRKYEDLIAHAQDDMQHEIKSRDLDNEKMVDDIKAGYEKRLAQMREDHDKDKAGLNAKIKNKEDELDKYNNEYIPEVQKQGNDAIEQLKDQIAALKTEKHEQDELFKAIVAKTKKQNDENHKIYDQNALINKLKGKVFKKSKKTGTENRQKKLIIQKLESFGYGYQKTFKSQKSNQPIGHLKRHVSMENKAPKKSTSLIRRQGTYIDYHVTDLDKENNHMDQLEVKGKPKKGKLKKYKSASKIRGVPLEAQNSGTGVPDFLTKVRHSNMEGKNTKKGNKRPKTAKNKSANRR